MWKNQYENIMNPNKNVLDHRSSCEKLFNKLVDNFTRFKPTEINEALKELKCGKAPEYDSLQAKYFKYADFINVRCYQNVFNYCIIHG
jgi:hypothetical protein